MKTLICHEYNFVGGMTPTLAGTADGLPFKRRITGAAPPTVTATSAGLQLALTSASQAQVAGLFFNDILSFDIDQLARVEFLASMTASFAETVVFGMASAANDTPESITAFSFFKLSANNNLLISTDDNVNDTTDVATGLTMGTALRRYVMDFGSGISSQVGALSTGGKSNVLFEADNAQGVLRAVARSQRFNMSSYSSGLQPYAQISKASGTNTGTLTIRRLRIWERAE
jgi:hypothetical protein